MDDKQLLALLRDCVDGNLESLPPFPCPMSEMTPREYEIAQSVCKLTGALQFIQKTIAENLDS